MKLIRITLLLTTLLVSLIGFSQPASISGSVNYLNAAATPLPQVTVTLQLSNNPFVFYSVQTQTNGTFSFPPVDPGVYTINISTTIPWAFVNTTDALKILQHWAGTAPLTGLYQKSADVTKDGYVTAADALAALRRVVLMIPSFSPPYIPAPGNSDWIWDIQSIIVNPGGTYTLNLHTLCTGDVDGI